MFHVEHGVGMACSERGIACSSRAFAQVRSR